MSIVEKGRSTLVMMLSNSRIILVEIKLKFFAKSERNALFTKELSTTVKRAINCLNL